MNDSCNLALPIHKNIDGAPIRIVVVGEVLWDVLRDSASLGGAPLNFSAHCKRLGHRPVLLSAIGTDDLGDRALREIVGIGLDVAHIQRSTIWNTGTASVTFDGKGQPTFQIPRPAAYDDFQLSETHIQALKAFDPSWLYFGTVFPSQANARIVLERLLQALPKAKRFYDVNLRPGSDSPELVTTLIAQADVVKLNETEAEFVRKLFGFPHDLEAFCRSGCERFGWTAICVTLGAEGCAVMRSGEFFRAEGLPVSVADTVGAGDAFAAALLHGLVCQWSIAEIARFANRVGALVASRKGAIPEWSFAEVASV